MKLFRQVNEILGAARTKLFFIVPLFFMNAFLDLVGISLIGPFLALIGDSQIILASDYGQVLHDISRSFGVAKVEVFIGLLICLLSLLKVVVSVFNSLAINKFCQSQQAATRLRLLNGYLAMDYLSFISKDQAKYIHASQALVSDFTRVLKLILQTSAEVVVALCLIVFLGFFDIAVLLTLVSLAFASVFVVDLFLKRILVRAGIIANGLLAEILKTTGDALKAFKMIKAFNASSFFANRLETQAFQYASLAARSESISEISRYIFEAFITYFIVALVMYAVFMEKTTTEMISLLGIYGFAGIRIFPLMKNFSSTLSQIRFRSAGLEVLSADLAEIRLRSKKRGLGVAAGTEVLGDLRTLKLEDIHFTYNLGDGGHQVLRGLSFEVSRAELIGVYGDSGQGKSTLLGLLLGLIKPHEGRILWNGVELDESQLEMLRPDIGFVSQELDIFNDTLINNVTLNTDRQSVDMQRLGRALALAGVDEFLSTLPDGLDTSLGDSGANISGGQRQRVAIARALYHGRNMLVLDEPTSALDGDVEADFLNAIKSISKTLPVILVSHKASSIGKCDKIYRLKDGMLHPSSQL